MADRPGAEPSTVLSAIRAGSEDALAELYRRWSPLVYSLALRRLGDVRAAEDVTQRVFIAIWNGRERWDPAGLVVPGWLIGLATAEIARRVAESGYRSAPRVVAAVRSGSGAGEQGRDQSGNLAPAESVTGSTAEDTTEQMIVIDELAQLGEVSRRVLRMTLSQNLSADEIAVRTRLSSSAVRSEIHGSLAKLRERLGANTDAC